MLFSILIPVYNVEEYLRECIDSVINQNFNDIEIILIDDGSTDNSGNICDEYVAKYSFVRCLHKKNQGLMAARRDAIRLANGKYCMFLDSDDFIVNNAFSCLYRILEEYNFPEMIIFNKMLLQKGEYKRFVQLIDETKVFCEDKTFIFNNFIKGNELNNMVIKLISTELLKSDNTDYTIYYDCPYSEDAVQSLYPITYAKKIVIIDEYLYIYRINSNSITQKKYSLNQINKMFNRLFYELLYKYLSIWNIDTEENRQIVYRRSMTSLLNIFFKIYGSCESKIEKKECLSYEWFNLLPEGFLEKTNLKLLSRKDKIKYKCLKKKKVFLVDFLISFNKIRLKMRGN